MQRLMIPTLMVAGAIGLWQLAPSTHVQAGASVDQQVTGPSTNRSFADVIEAVQPAVVNISVSGPVVDPRGARPRVAPGPPGTNDFEDFLRRFFERQSFDGSRRGQPFQGSGSGFIIDEEGFVVTNNHVVEHAAEITVTTGDGRQFAAELIGADEKTDLAVLQIDTDEALPFARFGDSENTRVGDWVIAIGNPFGLGGSATTGIVSARGRDIQSGPFDDFLQIDAPINRGNSGGPLFDLEGQVIGVNTAIYSPNGGNVGIGFAIPSAQAKTVIESLRASGRVERGWLGVTIQPIDEALASGLEYEGTDGALVASVVPESPAERAGLLPGDVILGFDGTSISRIKDLTRSVAAVTPDEEVELEVWREGKRKLLEVAVGHTPGDDQAAPSSFLSREKGPEPVDTLGLSLADLSDRAKRQLRLSADIDGAVVLDVKRGSAAEAAGLRQGDVIMHVGRRAVADADSASSALADAELDGRKSAALRILRDGQALFLAVPFG